MENCFKSSLHDTIPESGIQFGCSERPAHLEAHISAQKHRTYLFIQMEQAFSCCSFSSPFAALGKGALIAGKPVAARVTGLQKKTSYISLTLQNKLHCTKTLVPSMRLFQLVFYIQGEHSPQTSSLPRERTATRAQVSPCLLCPEKFMLCLNVLTVWQKKRIELINSS